MSENAPPEFTDLDPFVALMERRLYRQLITQAERALAKAERGDAYVPRAELLTSLELLEAARKVRSR